MNLGQLLATYGYAAVFVLVMVESLGVPLPGETILILAAVYAGHTHRLSVWAIFGVAAAAAVLGDNIGYWIGAKGGYRVVRRWGHLVHLSDSRIKVGWYLFARYGGAVVFFGRFVSVLRTYAAFLAGVNLMRWRDFTMYNVAGGVVWAGAYTFVSYHVGRVLSHYSTVVTIVALAVLAVALAAAAIIVHRGASKMAAKAEEAFPGPLDEARPRGPRPR